LTTETGCSTTLLQQLGGQAVELYGDKYGRQDSVRYNAHYVRQDD